MEPAIAPDLEKDLIVQFARGGIKVSAISITQTHTPIRWFLIGIHNEFDENGFYFSFQIEKSSI